MKTNDILLAHDCYSDMYWFMQVTKLTAKTVTMARIYSSARAGKPVVGEFTGEKPITKRINADGRSVHLGGWSGAELWDGKPLNNDHPMWGRNYNLY